MTVTVKVRNIDRYKRTVAEIVLPDGRNQNQELVRAGMAWWYQQFTRREMVLAALEQEARDAKGKERSTCGCALGLRRCVVAGSNDACRRTEGVGAVRNKRA